jgi:hypothetical protein
MGRYKWVYHGNYTEKLYDVGINADGSLHNPRGYPEDIVRQAVIKAGEANHKRRSEAAKRAAVTREERRERLVYQVADQLLLGGKLTSRNSCMICGKRVFDKASKERGIGSDCWQGVLSAIAARKVAS